MFSFMNRNLMRNINLVRIRIPSLTDISKLSEQLNAKSMSLS